MMFRLTLRKKLIIGFTIFLLISSLINFIFLKEFDSFQKNVGMIVHASHISNLSLEIRRYEKNFIIDRNIDDYKIASKFLDDVFEYINKIKTRVAPDNQQTLFKLMGVLDSYQDQFVDLKDKCIGKRTLIECGATEEIQRLGADMVTLSEGMVTTAESKINQFMIEAKIELSLYYAFLVGFSLIGMIVYHATIAKRLKFLEKAADSIAKGNYDHLPSSNANDEVQSVFNAFERMVVELEERQEQLFQAEKLSSIGTLASGMAHQLNNPLNNIATSCQLAITEMDELAEMRADIDCSFLHKLLGTIDEETQRSATIVRGLLEFSRSEMFTCKLTSIRDVINKAISLITSELPSGISIKQDIPEKLVAWVDEQKIKEVFLNLLINAIQAIKEAHGTILIAAEVDIETNWIIITVSDTGVGIDAADRQKIFDPFYSTKGVGEGTGLGLAVVYGIIKKHKGTISVISNKGKGSTFIISLPHA